MKTVTRNLLLSYSPISSDQLVELYCRRAEVVAAIYSENEKCIVAKLVSDDQIRGKLLIFAYLVKIS